MKHPHLSAPAAGLLITVFFGKRLLLFAAIIPVLFFSAENSMGQMISPSQVMSGLTESALLPKCLPPGTTIVSATDEITSDAGLSQAIQRAVAEWNRALNGSGAILSFEPYSENTNILIQTDSLMDQAGADSGIAEIVCKYSTDKEVKSEIDLSDVYVDEAKIGISTASKGDPQKLYSTILYQLGSLIGLNNPEFAGTTCDSSRAITPTRRKAYVTDYDLTLCKQRYSSHNRQQILLGFAKGLITDGSEAGRGRLKQTLSELRALVTAERSSY